MDQCIDLIRVKSYLQYDIDTVQTANCKNFFIKLQQHIKKRSTSICKTNDEHIKLLKTHAKIYFNRF